MIQKLIDEIEGLAVFGKTKITDLVLQRHNTQNDGRHLLVKRIEEGKSTFRDLFKAIDNVVNSI